jgi:hypothetical protein
MSRSVIRAPAVVAAIAWAPKGTPCCLWALAVCHWLQLRHAWLRTCCCCTCLQRILNDKRPGMLHANVFLLAGGGASRNMTGLCLGLRTALHGMA